MHYLWILYKFAALTDSLHGSDTHHHRTLFWPFVVWIFQFLLFVNLILSLYGFSLIGNECSKCWVKPFESGAGRLGRSGLSHLGSEDLCFCHSWLVFVSSAYLIVIVVWIIFYLVFLPYINSAHFWLGRTDGQMGEQTDSQMDRQVVGWMNGLIVG